MTRGCLVPLVVTALASPGVAWGADFEDNPWLEQRVMDMAHSGGEIEAPTNTMYAFKRAVGLGADMIELDVQSTADDELVVLHNATVDDTTNGSGEVADLSTDEMRALDAAHNFVPGTGTAPGRPEEDYPLRGVRTGQIPPPDGYTADDFAIPTLAEVFATFPEVPINIEIKGRADTDLLSFRHNAKLLAAFLEDSGRTDVIVTSFNDAALATFHHRAPEVPLAPGMAGIAAYFFAGVKPQPGTVALQIPVTFNGIRVATPAFIERAHRDGYAVHIWFSGSAPETEATYNELIDACADALMPARPSLLEEILDERGIVRPGRPGIDPCFESGAPG
ncbi:glycerophosphoryl diester phosphodiesterase [Stackebrandtia nassauensis DSM 44728]|uniref:Glycerophosphoryl diester phosphodiesterase n=1 Tax=Stackebrandtia nassauensis (strain DSM 44728 / CIP 108903 / NRRL B-16338 / NBRC 102104 / LLR-40K-21) TaxID=446470 RepID=D3Q1U5_STANL|nr:glycerophosphoryl diester phosphodiesterase [Stackebrandtia nassauensis DSM 44728]